MLPWVSLLGHGMLLGLACNPDSLIERVQREAPVAWNAYVAWAEQAGLQGTWRDIYTVVGPPKRTFVNTEISARFDASGRCGLAIIQNHPDSGVEDSDGKLEAVNGIYAFRLTRPVANAKWVLDRVERLPQPLERPKSFLVPPRAWCRMLHWSPFIVFNRGISLLEEMKDPDWRIVSAEELPGTQLIKVEFKTLPKKTVGVWWKPLKGGFVMLEPRRHWALHTFDLNLEHENGRKERLHGGYTYKEVANNWLVPERLDFTSESERTVSHCQTEFNLAARGHADEREFRLSYYGFPEPFGIEWERPTPWWLYAGITAGVVVLLIFLLGVWKRRLLARG